jgi:hypothetical protein
MIQNYAAPDVDQTSGHVLIMKYKAAVVHVTDGGKGILHVVCIPRFP